MVRTLPRFTAACMHLFARYQSTAQLFGKLRKTIVPLIVCLLAGPGLAQHSIAAIEPAIFLVGDSAQAIHLTDNPAAQGAWVQRISAVPVSSTAKSGSMLPTARRRGAQSTAGRAYEAIVQAAARTHRLDPSLLHAVIGVESGYDVRALSTRGAEGLMQLLPPTARSYGVTNAFDPHQNVPAGANHLRNLLNQFNGDMVLALAAYNAGANAVLRHGLQVPPYAETQAYVPRVLARWADLRARAALRAP